MNNNALGIDIGGTNIAFGIVSPAGEILYETSFPTKSFETPEIFVNFVYNHLFEKELLSDLKGIGVFEFGNEDIVRNPIIGEILNRYE